MNLLYFRLLLLVALLAGVPYPGYGTTLTFHSPESNRSGEGAPAPGLFLICDPSPGTDNGTSDQDLNLIACSDRVVDNESDSTIPAPEFQIEAHRQAPEETGTAQSIDGADDVQFLGDFASVLAQVNLVDHEELLLRFRRRRLTPGKIIAVTIFVFVLSSISLLIAGIRSTPHRHRTKHVSSTYSSTGSATS